MTTKPTILVTSAAGRTGAAAVLELLRMGFPVRAFVRRNDVRSEALRKAGAEIFVGDRREGCAAGTFVARRGRLRA